jgi:hypothetical protein
MNGVARVADVPRQGVARRNFQRHGLAAVAAEIHEGIQDGRLNYISSQGLQAAHRIVDLTDTREIDLMDSGITKAPMPEQAQASPLLR